MAFEPSAWSPSPSRGGPIRLTGSRVTTRTPRPPELTHAPCEPFPAHEVVVRARILFLAKVRVGLTERAQKEAEAGRLLASRGPREARFGQPARPVPALGPLSGGDTGLL